MRALDGGAYLNLTLMYKGERTPDELSLRAGEPVLHDGEGDRGARRFEARIKAISHALAAARQ